MNKLQLEAFDIASDGHNLLLLGSAGTGKSYVISKFVDRCIEQKVNCALTCTTGIACTIYDKKFKASTIHRWSGIGDGRHGPDEIGEIIRHNRVYSDVLKRIKETDVLIIDECSMLSQRFFETLQQVCSIRNPALLFGGIQLILCGDFLQLPPVPNKLYRDDGKYCFESDLFQRLFPHKVVLRECIRTREPELINSIEEVAKGDISLETEAFLKGLQRPLDKPVDVPKLLATNDMVDDINRNILLKTEDPIFESVAKDSGEDPNRLTTLLAPKVLWLRIGCPVMLLRNLSDQLVNGLIGLVRDLQEGAPILVEFPSLGKTVPVEKFHFTVFDPKKSKDVAERIQYPLKPAYGMTIHKSQGQTLNRVEIDCRGIFKPGQLAVALGRARHSRDIRVLNFSKRYCMKPPQAVLQIAEIDSTKALLNDRSCCRMIPRIAEHMNESLYTLEDLQNIDTSETDPQELDIDEQFDADFDAAIIGILEEEQPDTQLPQDLDLQLILDNIKFDIIVTTDQMSSNKIVHEIDQIKYKSFVMKEYAKLKSFWTAICTLDSAEPVSVSKQTEFYSAASKYHTSVEYRMNCMSLFDETFTENHLHVCFNISKAIKEYIIEKKATLYSSTSQSASQRQVTDSSQARIRYLAGYCVAKVRQGCFKQKQTYKFNRSEEGQKKYKEAKCALYILNDLKVEEQYVQETTSHPDSLVDIDRRQNTNRSLCSVSDDVFHFFSKLTEKMLPFLVTKTLNDKGSDLFQHVHQSLLNDTKLFDHFVSIVTINEIGTSEEMEEETAEETAVKTEQTKMIFGKFIKRLLMVMLNQFRKDVLDSLSVKKKMAHRKQIQISQPVGKTASKGKRKKSPARKKASKRKSAVVNKSSATTEAEEANFSENTGDTTSTTANDVEDSILVNVPSTSEESSASILSIKENLVIPSTSREGVVEVDFSEDDEDLVVCEKCETRDKDIDWLQCDSCEKWIHRLCAGLKNHMKWKKATKKGARFYCSSCQ